MVSERLKFLREKKDLTKKDMAQYLGVSDRKYGLLESGSNHLNEEQIRSLAKYFEVNADYLLGMSDTPNYERQIVDSTRNIFSNRQVKDTLLKALLSTKEARLELYNALNGTSYTMEDELIDMTLDDVIFLQIKNDVSFLIANTLNLYEHQSSYNPNMPLRNLFYYVKQLEQLVRGKNMFSSKLIELDTPIFVELYNGKRQRPEVSTVKLSDAFKAKGEKGENIGGLELTVTVYNINKGYNQNLMKSCEILDGYSFLVDRLRHYESKGYDKVEAVKGAIHDTISEDKIAEFLKKKGSEAMEFILAEYDALLVQEDFIAEGIEIGREQGREEGREEGKDIGREEMKLSMIKNLLDILDDSKIAEIAELPIEIVAEIRKQNSKI